MLAHGLKRIYKIILKKIHQGTAASMKGSLFCGMIFKIYLQAHKA